MNCLYNLINARFNILLGWVAVNVCMCKLYALRITLLSTILSSCNSRAAPTARVSNEFSVLSCFSPSISVRDSQKPRNSEIFVIIISFMCFAFMNQCFCLCFYALVHYILYLWKREIEKERKEWKQKEWKSWEK